MRADSPTPVSRAQRLLLAAGIVLAAFLGAGQQAFATSVISPDFGSMVSRAELIFTGRVTSQRAEWREIDKRRSIVTVVTFEVLDVQKGHAGRVVELQFLGGTIGDTTLDVSMMPKFSRGARSVLFVEKRGGQASPLVGFYHGRFFVREDDGIENHDGTALTDVSEVGRAHGKRNSAGRAMSHAAFADKVRQTSRGNR